MLATAELAGSFAAHGVWCVSEGGPLTPMLAHEMPDGSRHMMRLVMDDLRKAVDFGRRRLEENPEGARRAVLVCDG
jgi:hypothetical protein